MKRHPDRGAIEGVGTDGATDLVVVGGGVAGLVAAAFSARAGLSVRLFDKAGLGGRARTRSKGEHRLNLGAHALFRAQPFARALETLRVTVPGRRVPAMGQALLEDRLHGLPAGPVSMLTTGLLDARGKVELAGRMVWLRGLDPRGLEARTVGEVLDAEVAHPGVRALLLGLMRVATYDEHPEALAGDAGFGQLRRAVFHGVDYVDGGWQTLVDGLAATARALGAEIAPDARVRGPAERRGDVFRIPVGDGEVLARAVVVAAGPAVAGQLFPELALPPLEPVRAACLDVALGTVPRPHHRFVMGLDRPLYYSLHSSVARLAPEGQGVAHLLRYGGGTPSAEQELRALLDRMQPDARIVEARYLPEMTVAHHRPTLAAGGLRGRPTVETALPGVFLAGDWVGEEGLLADAAAASAARAAEAVTTHLRARRAA